MSQSISPIRRLSLTIGACALASCSSVDGEAVPHSAFVLASVAMGEDIVCGVTRHGAAYCWGIGSNGELGNGTMARDSTKPVAVQGLNAHVAAVSVGYLRACALTDGGAVRCWGEFQTDHELNHSVPFAVPGLESGVVAVSLGEKSVCAINSGRTVLCHNDEHGPPDTDPPVEVPGLPSNIQAISVGGAHACALTEDGAVFCWGSDDQGQLGTSAPNDGVTALPVDGMGSGVTSISAGQLNTCAITSAGEVHCWGVHSGFEGTNNLQASVAVSLSSPAIQVSSGAEHSCALTANGAVRCWGYNAYGELGIGAPGQESAAPTLVHTLSSGVSQISAGPDGTCALTDKGVAYCWGRNGWGAVGDGTEIDRGTPTVVDAP